MTQSIEIIAELANAHEGKIEIAKKICSAAAEAGADAIKFQIFYADEIAVPSFSYHSLYRQLEQPAAVWEELTNFARCCGLRVYADVSGRESALVALNLGLEGYKIHAADVSNEALLRSIGAAGKRIFLSCGGSFVTETADAIRTLRSAGATDIVLMHGFQSYPTKLEDSFLLRIGALAAKHGLPVGYAGHLDGGTETAVQLPCWAVAAGASCVEVHITLDRSAQGLDYFSSLDPINFRRMVDQVRVAEAAAGNASPVPGDEELAYRRVHKKQLVAVREIAQGEVIGPESVALKRVPKVPSGRPLDMSQAIGRRAAQLIPNHSPISSRNLRMKTAAVIACRLESTRLFGKPMQLIGEHSILDHLVARLRRATSVDCIVLAIGDAPGKSVFLDYAARHALPHVVGSQVDVLARLVAGAELVQADIVVRQTPDCPFTFWQDIDELIHIHIDQNADYTITSDLPLGAGVQVISTDALRTSHRNGQTKHRSELCDLFIIENPEIFNIVRKPAPDNLRRPQYRLTVDTPDDLKLARYLQEKLGKPGELLALADIVAYLDTHPEVALMNVTPSAKTG